jgi:LmbE family N-acetylglucosaminyl deacetylase
MCILLVILLFTAWRPQAQTPPAYASSEIFLKIKKLKVLGTVLYFAAHPDDENTRLITWFSNDQLLRTGYLSLTRGDGGQNLIGDEQGVELGLIRTQELLAARRIDGGEQFFTRAFDFGYSKSTEEALRIWGKDKVLSDAVWVIRQFQPDVIITRFPPDSRAGHGHHSASAVLAREAFKAAADKNAFPEQLKYGVTAWQAKRLVWNGYNFNASAVADSDKVNIDAGGFNPLLGRSYGEIAAESRSQHKSQGFGVAPSRGAVIENFSHTEGSEAKKMLTDGIDMSWQRIGAPSIGTAIDSILRQYDLSDPSLSVPALVKLYQLILALPEGHWKKIKLQDLQNIIADASGVWLDACADQSFVRQGEDMTITFSINNRQGIPMRIDSAGTGGMDTLLNSPAARNANINFQERIHVPADMPVSQPYWLREKMNEGSYNVNEQMLIGVPDVQPSYTAAFGVTIAGQHFIFTRPVKYKHTDPVKGEIYEPFIIVPSINNVSRYGILRHIHYDHIPDIYYFLNDTAKITLKDVKTAGSKIGYIEGAGDKVPAALALMGYQVTVLKEKDITAAYLSQFDAVMTGVRAYNVHSYLFDKNNVFNEYVKNGGNMIVQYNVNGFSDPHGTIGPYPFTISRSRITDEHSPVRFLLPQHPVLNYPNRITQADFLGWKQERGIYSAEQLDPAFKAPLGMSDPGEEEQHGSLIIADYGKGKFVYTGIVFFRELPAGINGAYRLLANIIALNRKMK